MANAAVLGEPESVARDADITFAADRTIRAFDGTNTINGRYSLTATGIRFTGVGATLIGLLSTAPQVRRDLQAAFNTFLAPGMTAEIHVVGKTLLLRSGTWVLTLSRPVEG